MTDTKTLDTLSGVLVLLGVTQGLVPFAAKALGWTPVWSLPRHLDAPAWWAVSLLVLAACALTVLVLERVKARAGG